ncbi:YitT family protein [Facklamia sp. P12945]|uniref:YitT family protein n=1 Tax=unclassified Facklamia TaxID=2622293 RepID=UPI003D183D03
MIIEYIQQRPWLNFLFELTVALTAALCIGIGLKLFLMPGNIFSSGTSGLAQILNYFAVNIPVIGPYMTVGNIYFLFNIPIIILSWVKLGKQFTIWTLIVVFVSSLATNMIPLTVISSNPLLNAIIGGVICGIGSGITIKYGMSCGGLDIITLVISRATDMNVAFIGFAINSLIILASGLLYDWEFALYTLISIYALAKTIDAIHTNEQRLTALVVTNNTDEVVNAIYKSIVRGVTILEGQGGYSRDKRDVLMVVLNRYEMFPLEQAIRQTDPKAFINFIRSNKVVGHFFSRDQQKAMRKQVQVDRPLEEESEDFSFFNLPMEFDQLYDGIEHEDDDF